jgi:subtilisin family serine protease
MSETAGSAATVEARRASPALELVRLERLMALTDGRSDITVGLIDGPVDLHHPGLVRESIRELPSPRSTPSASGGAARDHGTFIAGMLAARRDSGAPAICPGSSLVVRPMFVDAERFPALPAAAPEELATAIVDCVDAGARVLNLSVAMAEPSPNAERALEESLDHAARSGVVTVVAAGNQGAIGTSAITRHPGVVPVAAADARGWPLAISNLGPSIGRRGLLAAGVDVTSLAPASGTRTWDGTSVATPFVTGAIALLWSLFPEAKPAEIRLAIGNGGGSRRRGITPPLLDAWGAYEALLGEREESRWVGR